METIKQKYADCAKYVLRELGVTVPEDFMERQFASNEYRTKEFNLHGVTVSTEIVIFGEGTPSARCRIDIDFSLPKDGILADTFMDHCAAIEKTPKNHAYEYCHGPMYRDYAAELQARKQTFALSPWHNTMFYVRSEGYPMDEFDQAVGNAVALARQFSAHVGDLASLRYWKTDDPEVIAKAKEIVQNASFTETDCDREEKAYWLVDENSFFKGWFFPFNDRGRGTFDTYYKPYYAAIGIEGSFEYAVSCLLLYDKDYIAAARKACRIRKETVTLCY